MVTTINYHSFRKKTLVTCPMCGKDWFAKIFYTGNGKPRVFHHNCKKVKTGDRRYGVEGTHQP